MITLEAVAPGSAESLRAIRLRALQDSPWAFGSTYARESQLSPSDWEERAARWNGAQAACYMAWDGDEPCGIAAGQLDPEDGSRAHLLSMWVAPDHRGQGVGRLLVGQVKSWARDRQAKALVLMVTSSNEGAILFYQRLGFVMTGNAEPYPNDAALVEFEMLCLIEFC